ncbi:phenylalanyl-tRNA synthetase beta chain [Strigomonas culicis]|uniref:phenylalanine--tRNA ligase n=1 Tax=Strigomonas culicis TaxID=28005 RepID=S9VIL9_9TRYP|nr:phenylalanyl-tRNA synthetase beta chain [Strigomonas culicis]|eukprot:EPY23080.1 phenylalanyl-tRNA synthetase beta chain [Strigomonas culicis]
MPTLAVAKEYLGQLLGRSYTDEQFDELCFQFGVELDGITSEREMYMREQGKTAGGGKAINADHLCDEVIYKIDTPANRYDLLSAEGMAIALKVFLGAMPLPAYKVHHAANPLYHMVVRKEVRQVRDYIVCAVLKNIHFTERSYNSFIDFQEKLHSGLARRRTLVSVGTHDLDKIANNHHFIYTAKPREKIQFVPLNQTRLLDCTGDGLAQYYAEERHISQFVPLVAPFPAYPVVLDSTGETVLSLPPIINSATSCISGNTKNIFIECTATDHYKAHVLVNQMVCAFSSLCEDPFTVEAVRVQYEEPAPDGTKECVCPDLSDREETISLAKVNQFIGVQIPSRDACEALLKKMMYLTNVHGAAAPADADAITVRVPAVRSDVLATPDVMEDVAIAYGYANIEYKECHTHGDVTQTPLNKVAQLLRQELASAGYVELLTFSLCSRDDAFAHLRRVDADTAVHIANPQTFEFQVCRPSLLPGMLKTTAANKAQPLPHRFFECADVVLLDNAVNFPAALEPTLAPHEAVYPSPGARNQRHVAALHCSSNSSSFECIHALTEYTLMKLSIPRVDSTKDSEPQYAYEFVASADGAFFPGRAVDVVLHVRRGTTVERIVIGQLGVIHPEVLKAYDISFPCSYMELNIQFACRPVAN